MLRDMSMSNALDLDNETVERNRIKSFGELEPGTFFRGVDQDDIYLKNDGLAINNAVRVETGAVVSFGRSIRVIEVYAAFYESE